MTIYLISIFCTPGGHSIQFAVGRDLEDPLTTPPGWQKVEADCVATPRGPDDPWAPGIWYAKEGTGCWVLACPIHHLQPIE